MYINSKFHQPVQRYLGAQSRNVLALVTELQKAPLPRHKTSDSDSSISRQNFFGLSAPGVFCMADGIGSSFIRNAVSVRYLRGLKSRAFPFNLSSDTYRPQPYHFQFLFFDSTRRNLWIQGIQGIQVVDGKQQRFTYTSRESENWHSVLYRYHSLTVAVICSEVIDIAPKRQSRRHPFDSDSDCIDPVRLAWD